jgi:hypothetical protein
MIETALVLYMCAECDTSELLAEIIPNKSCEKCGILMRAEEEIESFTLVKE